MFKNDLKKIEQRVLKAIKAAKSETDLEQVRLQHLSRHGELAVLLKQLKDLPPAEKKSAGQAANAAKEGIETALQQKGLSFQMSAGVTDGGVDVTMPGHSFLTGNLHPSTIIQQELEDICRALGFRVLEGPDIESEYYNFTALNIPADHPARDTQDTFWLKKEGQVLKTHTSAMQVRALEKYGAPLRAVFPGRCFRYEATDASHDTTFYQLEGLMVDKNVSITHLIGVMKELLRAVFGKDTKVRQRPGFFSFVEPGFELDISCFICDGEGCSVCKRTGWVELLPCGLVHPEVIKAGGLDPKVWSGFAFGLGLTRLVMMKYGIDDIRLLQGGDLRFLKQFG
ncbi:MAG: phenylalanine--tRNA ligase subunit alpha [Candidatus Komeilibacteria bacterium]|nr:phenylalanine--tRNA ligase subunit alpha [Candidatus Komeilibacteria bacterium]